MSPLPMVLEFGMGVDVHGLDCTKAACRAVSDAIRHSSLPLLGQIRDAWEAATAERRASPPRWSRRS